jgi:uncharacterized RDD family membrane protein YckC
MMPTAVVQIQAPPRLPETELIKPGQTFGHYQIVRQLGGGGMGTVFEAEDIDNSRRVALKVLSHKLDAPAARERFFREGRLAAAINHPNSVYIFGTEEIAGIPVIAMELVPGGTLQQQVASRGPLPAGEAVDAVLQIIDGLEAAQKAGILHRDIKPSNCFLGPEGGVKIGDFGLSISTEIRTEPALTADGAFLGTPSFCPPEQLRGEELNVRSDIYSVGATLFYLLTGRTPFEAQNAVALIATVLEKPSPSPRDLRADIPQGLAKAVQRCLQKQRGDRYADYAELRGALAPFSSAAPVPAPLPMRFLAGCLDTLLLGLIGQVVIITCAGNVMDVLDQMSEGSTRTLLMMVGWIVVTVLYYAVLEGRFGASVGKRLCGVQVALPNRSAPGIPRALVRAMIWGLLPPLPFWIITGMLQEGGWWEFVSHPDFMAVMPGANPVRYYLISLSPYLVMALLFATARRHNGWAAVHDLLTSTRVTIRRKTVARPALAQESERSQPASEQPGKVSVGPYKIIQTLQESPESRWILGFDMRLLRKVWIRQVPAGAESFPARLRNLGRASRLRWLAGRRGSDENWDTFEAPSGLPLLRVIEKPQPWGHVRFWLLDIAGEMEASLKDQTQPAQLGLDRVWITDEGKAKLLDHPAPGLAGQEALHPLVFTPEQVQAFLSHVAVSALKGQVQTGGTIDHPIPFHARQFIESLDKKSPPQALTELASLMHRPSKVTRSRRAMLATACAIFPLMGFFAALLGSSFMRDFHARYPEVLEMNEILSQRQAFRIVRHKEITDRDFAVYIASRYGNYITNNPKWKSGLAAIMVSGKNRTFAENSVATVTNATPGEVARANKLLGKSGQAFATAHQQLTKPSFLAMMVHITLIMYVGIPAVIAALAFRGGLVLLIARVGFATRNGSPASRLRLLWRAIVTWSPAALAAVLCGLAMEARWSWIGFLPTFVLLALNVWSVALPQRGLQDRLAGTWPVPK